MEMNASPFNCRRKNFRYGRPGLVVWFYKLSDFVHVGHVQAGAFADGGVHTIEPVAPNGPAS